MRSPLLFGLLSLVPAAFSPAPAAPAGLALCSGDGQARVLALPILPGKAPASEPCCAKGCHGGTRKRKPAHN